MRCRHAPAHREFEAFPSCLCGSCRTFRPQAFAANQIQMIAAPLHGSSAYRALALLSDLHRQQLKELIELEEKEV